MNVIGKSLAGLRPTKNSPLHVHSPCTCFWAEILARRLEILHPKSL